MTNNDYRKALEAAITEIEGLLAEQERIASRVLSLRKTVYALSSLCQEMGEKINWRENASARLKEVMESSVTDDIWAVVAGSIVPLTTTEIRNELEKIGSLEEHKNPLATINAILARLKEQGKVTETSKNGRKVWEKRVVRVLSKAPPPITTVR